MILIFSVSEDLTTDWVIDWLNYYKYPLFRLNSSDIYNDQLRIDLLNRQIFLDNIEIPIEKIKAVWFRKFGLKKDFDLLKTNNDFKICSHLHEEHLSLFNTICYLLKNKNWLTNPSKTSLNKCEVLLDAKDLGFNIPETHLLNNKDDLVRIRCCLG